MGFLWLVSWQRWRRGRHVGHKYNANGYPCCRWTCPQTGQYSIVGQFSANVTYGGNTFIYVVTNGYIMFSNHLQSSSISTQPVSFTNPIVSLNQGDFIDFTIVWDGQNGGLYTGWTGVGAVISLLQSSQPPLSIRVSQVELCWNTATNTWSQLQYKSSLTTNQWVPFMTNWIVSTGNQFCTNDTVSVGSSQRYYRVAVTNSPP